MLFKGKTHSTPIPGNNPCVNIFASLHLDQWSSIQRCYWSGWGLGMGIFKSSPGGSNVQPKLRTSNLAVVLSAYKQPPVHTSLFNELS